MKTQLKLILMAIFIAFGRICALPAWAAKGDGDKDSKPCVNFLRALCVVLFAGIITGCNKSTDRVSADAIIYNCQLAAANTHDGGRTYALPKYNACLLEHIIRDLHEKEVKLWFNSN